MAESSVGVGVSAAGVWWSSASWKLVGERGDGTKGMEVPVLGVTWDSFGGVLVTMDGGIKDWATMGADGGCEVLGSTGGGGGAMSPVEAA